MNLAVLLFNHPAYKILDPLIMYPLFVMLGLIGLWLGYKRRLFSAIWLISFILGFAFMQFRGITENLPENFLTEPTFNNIGNSYISMTIGVLINLVGLFIERKERVLR